eukprot:Skav220457  [mRNA]  locus=scaffold254:290737:299736:- [translate_table: standard]
MRPADRLLSQIWGISETRDLGTSAPNRSAIVLDFIHGKSGDKVLADNEDKAPAILSELAATLAKLHQVNWPEERTVRDIRSGYPLCNTGDLLRGEEPLPSQSVPGWQREAPAWGLKMVDLIKFEEKMPLGSLATTPVEPP